MEEGPPVAKRTRRQSRVVKQEGLWFDHLVEDMRHEVRMQLDASTYASLAMTCRAEHAACARHRRPGSFLEHCYNDYNDALGDWALTIGQNTILLDPRTVAFFCCRALALGFKARAKRLLLANRRILLFDNLSGFFRAIVRHGNKVVFNWLFDASLEPWFKKTGLIPWFPYSGIEDAILRACLCLKLVHKKIPEEAQKWCRNRFQNRPELANNWRRTDSWL